MAPLVSIVVPAYNLARFLPAALDSALAQDWPAEALEVIVVDDGSSDETPSVLATYGDRIQALHQENRGLVGAVDRGLAQASGEYLALLDADDEWPRDRVRRQVEFLEGRPAVGLVHGDMELIDADGATTAPSFFERQGHNPARGRVLGELLGGNFISGGASMMRASLLAAVHPIAPEAAYPDWWLAANVAAVAEIEHLPGIFNRYRFHGANMGLGAAPERMGSILRKEIPWRRWMLRHLLGDSSVTARHLLAAFRAWEHGLLRAGIEIKSASPDAATRELVAVDQADRDAARELSAAGLAALAGGDALEASRMLMRAIAEDPWDGATRFDLEIALGQAQSAPAAILEDPTCTLVTREVATLAWAHELLAEPALLEAYGVAVDGSDPATLVMLLRPGEGTAPVVELVASLGLDQGDSADLLAISAPATLPARRLLENRASAVLGPGFEHSSLPAHPALAETASAR